MWSCFSCWPCTFHCLACGATFHARGSSPLCKKCNSSICLSRYQLLYVDIPHTIAFGLLLVTSFMTGYYQAPTWCWWVFFCNAVLFYAFFIYPWRKQQRFALGCCLHKALLDAGWQGEKLCWPSTAPYFVYEYVETRKHKRKTISKVQKLMLWREHFGSQFDAKCKVCRYNDINAMQFEACHKISVKHGGTNHLANLLPGCSMCNRASGTEHPEAFAKRLH